MHHYRYFIEPSMKPFFNATDSVQSLLHGRQVMEPCTCNMWALVVVYAASTLWFVAIIYSNHSVPLVCELIVCVLCMYVCLY